MRLYSVSPKVGCDLDDRWRTLMKSGIVAKYPEHIAIVMDGLVYSAPTVDPKIPGQIKRGDLVFEMEGLNHIDYIRVFATDTSFESPGINRIDTVKNGRIIITMTELESLVNGPINLEFYKEDERNVRNGTKEGGVIDITYGVKREFELKLP